MKDVVDKCSTKGCAIDIGTVIDNDNCTSKFSGNGANLLI